MAYNFEKMRSITCKVDCELVVEHVVENLQAWQHWAYISKIGACVLGGSIAAITIAVGTKKLPDFRHYMLSTILAALVYIMGVLQPYEEYKQFRLAYAKLERAYMDFVNSNRDKEALEKLINEQSNAREHLKEDWSAPNGESI